MFKLFIDYNGDCLLCSNDWAKKKIIGNAKKQNIYNIWNSEMINKARKMLLKDNRNFSPCDKCDVNGLLNGNEFRESWRKYLFEKNPKILVIGTGTQSENFLKVFFKNNIQIHTLVLL